MKINIRKATLNDAEEVAELMKQFWEVHKDIYPLIKPAKKLNKKDQVIDAKRMIKSKKSLFYVAEIDRRVIAAMELMIKKNDKFFKIRKYGFLDSITVHKDYRKRGVAREMTNFALAFFKKKGIKYIVGKVFNDNRIALEAWKRIGFEPRSTNLFMELK